MTRHGLGIVVLGLLGCDDPRSIEIEQNPLECASHCDEKTRQCSREACCACTQAGGGFTELHSYPPIYGCRVGELGNSEPLEGFDGNSYCEWPYCEDSPPADVDVDEEGRLGDLARAELEQLVGTHVSALEWAPDASRPFDLNVPDKHTQLTTHVAYAGGRIVIADSQIIIPNDGEVGPIECVPEIEIEVDVRLESADGMLDGAVTLDYRPSPWGYRPELEDRLALADLSDQLEARVEGLLVDEVWLELWVVRGPGGWLYGGPDRGPLARWWPL